MISGSLDTFIGAVQDTTVDTSDFERFLVRTSLNMLVLDIKLEVIGLTVDGVRARFYVRGTSHEFAEADVRDHYLRALGRIGGDRGEAAREAFLQGWVEYRGRGDVEPFVWHRLIGDTALSVRAVG